MSFRGRLVGAVSLSTLATLGGAFATVSVVVNRAQERRLDEALREEATREATDLGRGAILISDRPGPAANDVGPLPKYAVVYGPDGAVLTETPIFRGHSPPRDSLRHAGGECFDFHSVPGVPLRGVVVAVPGRRGVRLLLAAPRADLDGDAAFLARAMSVVFVVAVVWSVVVAYWVVRRLTRDHQRIAAVARRVAAGDLQARIASRSRDREIAQLARDVDDMITRLAALVTSQRQFVAHAAHELRSPLTTLYGELSHALRRPRDEAEYRRVIEEVLGSTRQLKQLAEDLLALARVGAEPADAPELADSEGFVREAAGWVARGARARGVRLEVLTEGGEGRAMIRGNTRDLARMLRNLLDNALAYSPPDGRVEVRLSRSATTLRVSVTDEGPGVPEAERERIFEPFYRGASERAAEGEGAGLGLAIAREIARAHGGDVALEDSPRGARFVVTLPRGG